jgi:acetyltransferase-like isoleucine patch superfamily enzyme
MRENPLFDSKGMTQWYWRVLHKDNLKLGSNTEIGSFTVIDAYNNVIIGDNVKIGFNCTIISHSSIDGKCEELLYNNNCKIGSNSVIMPGVEIGENSIIGACSFVNSNIPPMRYGWGACSL